MLFEDFSILWSIILISLSVFCLFLSSYSLHRRYINGASELSLFLFTVALFSLFSVLEVNGFTLERISFFVRIGYFLASFTVPSFFLFSFRYFMDRNLPRYLYILLLGFSFLVGASGWLPLDSGFLYTRYWLEFNESVPSFHYDGGILYYLQLAYLISLALSAEFFLILKIFRSGGKVRKQALFVFMGSSLPTLNILLFPERMGWGFDTQPLILGVMGFFISVALFRYQMFDILKAAREKAVDNIGDGLVVLDEGGIILDINRKGRELAPLVGFRVGKAYPDDSRFGVYLENIIYKGIDSSFEDKTLFKMDDRYYRVFVSPLGEDRHEREAGFVVIVHDMTDIVNLVNNLEHHASFDSLTGIFNRRHWMELVKSEWDESVAQGLSVAVIIFDIDHFKQINDTHGHIFGDKVLSGLAGRVKDNLRPSEIFGRYGGEEFCIFCSVGDRETAYTIGDRIRRIIGDEPFVYGRISVTITASVGVYHSRPERADNLDDSLKKADEALYLAKKSGRNRTILFAGPGDRRS